MVAAPVVKMTRPTVDENDENDKICISRSNGHYGSLFQENNRGYHHISSDNLLAPTLPRVGRDTSFSVSEGAALVNSDEDIASSSLGFNNNSFLSALMPRSRHSFNTGPSNEEVEERGRSVSQMSMHMPPTLYRGRASSVKSETTRRVASPRRPASRDDMISEREEDLSENETIDLLMSYVKEVEVGEEPFVWTNRLRAILLIMAVSQLSNTVCFSCIAPFYPAEAKMKGLTPTQTGLVFSLYELVAFIMSPIWGRLVPKIGMKFMFVTGLAASGVNMILFGVLKWAPGGTTFFILSMTIRAVCSLSSSAFTTSSFSISAHVFRARQSTVVGILETAGGIGFALGPTMGGFLYEAGGFILPFALLGSFMISASITAFFTLPTFSPTLRRESTAQLLDDDSLGEKPTILNLLRIPTIWVMYICIMSVAIIFSFVEPTLQPHLDPFGLSMSQVGLFFLIMAGFYTAMSPIWGFIADRRPQYTTFMQIGAALMVAVGLLLIGPSPILPFESSLLIIGCGLAVLGVAIGALFIPTFEKCLDIAVKSGYTTNVELYGTVSGLFQSAFSLGGFFGPSLGTILSEHIGFEWGVTCIAGLMMVDAIILSINLWHTKVTEKFKMKKIIGVEK